MNEDLEAELYETPALTEVDHWWAHYDAAGVLDEAGKWQLHLPKDSDMRWSICGIWVGSGSWTNKPGVEKLKKCPDCLRIGGYGTDEGERAQEAIR
jgi:hypothetical protein